jgi:hypothetical protein
LPAPHPSSITVNELLHRGRSELDRTQYLKSILNTVSTRKARPAPTPSPDRRSFAFSPEYFSDECEEEGSECSTPINFLDSFWAGGDQTGDDSEESPHQSPLDAVLQSHTDSTGITIEDALDFVSGFVCQNPSDATSESSASSAESKPQNNRRYCGMEESGMIRPRIYSNVHWWDQNS